MNNNQNFQNNFNISNNQINQNNNHYPNSTQSINSNQYSNAQQNIDSNQYQNSNQLINNDMQNTVNNSQIYNSNNMTVTNNQLNFNNNINTNNNLYQQNTMPNYGQFYNNMQKPKVKFSITNKNKLVILLSIILIVIVSALFFLNLNLSGKSRTIMVYMVGSNLEADAGLATADLNSIKYDLMDNKNIKVIVLAGGSERWHNNYIKKEETSIYELTEKGYQKVKSQELKNMGNSETLSSYLNYVYDNYKTDEYSLVFWNHGGAIDGSEYDDLFKGDNLTLIEMKNALSNSNFKGNNKLEAIMFRTCLNGTIEVADILKEHSDYLIASEEITLGSSNTSVLNFVNNIEKKDTGKDIGMKFIDSYKKQINDLKSYSGNSQYIYSTYSIVDLAEIDKLIVLLNEFSKDINVNENYNEIAKIRSKLYQYAYEQAGVSDYDTIDLYNLIEEIKQLSPAKANKILKQFEKVVVYNWATNNKSRGLSIYFPYNGSQTAKKTLLETYNGFSSFTEYKNLIDKFHQIQNNGKPSYSFISNKTTMVKENEEVDITIELSEEQKKGFAGAEYLIFEDKGNGYYWPAYKGKDTTLEGNILKAPIKGKHLKMADKEGEYTVPLFETYNEEDYIKYYVSAILQDFRDEDMSKWKTDGVEMSIVYNKKTQEFEIDSAVLNSKNKTINNIAVDINNYDYIAFGSTSSKILDKNGNVDMENFGNDNNGIFEGIELKIEELELKLANFDKEKNYYCTFRIYDVNNNVYYSKLIKIN